MKILLENWNTYINEAHGLSQEDLDYVRDFADKTDDENLKRILKLSDQVSVYIQSFLKKY